MTTDTKYTTFKKADVLLAYNALSIQHRNNQQWISALMRGWENLAARRWQWDGSRLLIQSTSEPAKRYAVTQAGCECHAGRLGQLCDHMTSWHLCHEADRIRTRAQRRTKYLDIDAAVAELF